MQTGLHRNTISKVYRQLETDGVVEAMAGSGIYVRDQQARDPHPSRIATRRHRPDRGAQMRRRSAQRRLHAAADPRMLPVARLAAALRRRVLVSTLANISASMLISEVEPSLGTGRSGADGGAGKRLGKLSNGTVVTGCYFLQPVEDRKKHGAGRCRGPQRLRGTGDAEGTPPRQLWAW